jgi:hypothetical protein
MIYQLTLIDVLFIAVGWISVALMIGRNSRWAIAWWFPVFAGLCWATVQLCILCYQPLFPSIGPGGGGEWVLGSVRYFLLLVSAFLLLVITLLHPRKETFEPKVAILIIIAWVVAGALLLH